MPPGKDDLLNKLLATFRVEAEEHLGVMSSSLIVLERSKPGAPQADIIERVFREVHSLKGAARAVNLTQVEAVCQAIEGVFAKLKSRQITVSAALFDLLHRSLDLLARLIVKEHGPSGAESSDSLRLIRQLDSLASATDANARSAPERQPPRSNSTVAHSGEDQQAASASLAPGAALSSETVRVSAAKVASVMRQAEELLLPAAALKQRVRDVEHAIRPFGELRKLRSKIQPFCRSLERSVSAGVKPDGPDFTGDDLRQLLDVLDSEQILVKALEGELARLARSIAGDERTLSGMSEALLRDVKDLQLLPFTTLLQGFPRFVRDLARDQGKEAELVIQGAEIEIDRRILEEVKDPLIHLLRNCIDHGIARPDVRLGHERPRAGTIQLILSQRESGKVEVLVSDDGAGVDLARVRASALRQGSISSAEAEAMSDRDVLELVFRSGISTSPFVTDVSGRGLGLAIVREKIEQLGGMIAIESRPGEGTSFRIVLPMTLATMRGVLVRVGDRQFAVPALGIERVLRVPADGIRTVENRETILLDDKAVSLVWLADVLDLPRGPVAGRSAVRVQVVVLSLGLNRIAYRVDEVLSEQEILVKGLGPQLAGVRNVGGATVLGTGQVVPVLNVPDLLKSAVLHGVTRMPTASVESDATTAKQSILVVEDSITARTLLKNILEAAGYQVTTAVDGVDAFMILRTGRFDLVVSDVDMPRMNGFDLTAKIRADKRLLETPVVLVTALESREDRERGVDSGANAYIVKSSFDQSNLVEAIRRLI
ncbi:hybrid sensor histidine kinase/response regulator [Dongia deserti]|uniref:hybrid sensor histidine kinase/response regulator n=1 Tax=Dongia deserti TaxID=2268030 RepID=UPI000E64F181|nr:hybrid sensor histidine kinase/response regulator [Dongia deserti]